jgi:hypothetical protein
MAKTIFKTVFWLTALSLITFGVLSYRDGGSATRNKQTRLEHMLCRLHSSRC